MVDEINARHVEQHLAQLEASGRAPATVNRYRDRLSAMFKRALRLGLATVNPAKGIEKHKEPGGRIVYLPPATSTRGAYEEDAIRSALTPSLRSLFTVSVHTGLRWSEQVNLRWRDIDMLTGTITIPQSKHGEMRQVPMNVIVRSVVMDLGALRRLPGDSTERVFDCPYQQAAKFFPQAVRRRSVRFGMPAETQCISTAIRGMGIVIRSRRDL